MRRFALIPTLLATLLPGSAQALCRYKGVDNARTTIEQEFRDAPVVLRARVVEADYHWSDLDESWARYRLEIIERFKGPALDRPLLFTFRNSGGFYLDADGGGPDLDRDYLLFLDTPPVDWRDASVAKGAWLINYSCGVSGLWSGVSDAQRSRLRQLARMR